ncbi:MAG: aminopeptidase P family protein [Clostridia bacterium]|nr:aminopeptidase P family protein [Clostridia bacterium]
MRERAEKALALAQAAGAEALCVRSRANRFYLTAFHGSAGTALVTAAGLFLLVDFRYAEAAREAAKESGAEVREVDRPRYGQQLKDLVRAAGVRRLAFEAERETFAGWQALAEALAPEVELVPVRGLVEELRRTKSEAEIALMREAGRVTVEAFGEVLGRVRPGMSERELAFALEGEMQRRGAEGAAYPTIVASGPRGSRPHAEPSERAIEAGDLVTVDCGARWRGYCADLTRTFAVGRPSDRQREIHAAVQAAFRAAAGELRPGARAADVDRRARAELEAFGLADRFGHGLGHGVGLEVHERPSLGRESQDVLALGDVVTVEPGVYLPGFGGVRIEDTFWLGPEGPVALTPAPRDLIIL